MPFRETLPGGAPFPYRDLILLCAFAVVLGTLVLQGLTLKPLIRRIGLTDGDPVGREIRLGRTHAYSALLDAIKDDDTLARKIAAQGIRRGRRSEHQRATRRDRSTRFPAAR